MFYRSSIDFYERIYHFATYCNSFSEMKVKRFQILLIEFALKLKMYTILIIYRYSIILFEISINIATFQKYIKYKCDIIYNRLNFLVNFSNDNYCLPSISRENHSIRSLSCSISLFQTIICLLSDVIYYKRKVLPLLFSKLSRNKKVPNLEMCQSDNIIAKYNETIEKKNV